MVSWNKKECAADVYTSKFLVFENRRSNGKSLPCLLVYPRFQLKTFSRGQALKVTENSIGIFNDSPTECLPMGKRIYESDMTLPVYSVEDDMKGWDAKYEITGEKSGLRYRIHPSKYSDRAIVFTIPRTFFGRLKSQAE